MNRETMITLEYDRVKEMLASFAVSDPGKKKILTLEPSLNKEVIENWLTESTEARAIVDQSSSVPLHSLSGIKDIMEKLGKGITLLPEELTQVDSLLREGRRLKRFLKEKGYVATTICSYALSINDLEGVSEEIQRCIHGGQVDDKASPELAKVRKKISVFEERIRSKLDSILKSPTCRTWLQDNLISMRQGRYVIPVKSEYRKNIQGQLLDTSASGATVFIEPAEVSKAQNELNLLRLQEEKEVYRILAALTAMVEYHRQELSVNIETLVQIDFAFAKGKFSKATGGKTVSVNNHRKIRIRGGKHPLLGSAAVPLDFTIGDGCRALVITGPNTGGKTVVLKTVGLMTLMVQSGLHVPVQEGSEFAVYQDVLADIGDGQSIEHSLSTFSSHIRNIAKIIQRADAHTLVVLDELGAGTDPQEGTGLAIAILEKLYKAGVTLLATTHYSEIKTFAFGEPGFSVGCMEFDIDTLRPLYRLTIGVAGDSNALLIALRLGMDPKLIERAHQITYHEYKEYRSIQPAADCRIEVSDTEKAETERQKQLGLKIKKARQKAEQRERQNFNIGDSVMISSMGRTGIVYEEANGKGEVGVMVMRQKFKINQKRLSLYIEASKLYPENYDMDIVLESKENRKKRKIMSKRHVKGITIQLDP